MLKHYFTDPQTLRKYQQGPIGPYLEEFINWFEKRGYTYSYGIRRHIRGADCFARWAEGIEKKWQHPDADVIMNFGKYLQKHRTLKYPCGNYSHDFVGARHFVSFLKEVSNSRQALPESTEPDLFVSFCQWMKIQRGTMDSTLNNYRLTIIDLLKTLGDQPEKYTAETLRTFVVNRANRHGSGNAKTVVTSVRMFLRFLIATGRCTPGIDHAIPTFARWRLATLPKYLPADTVEQVIASCNLSTPVGVRDRSVLLLLARLGLRAGDVASLKLSSIDWQSGVIKVKGKNRQETLLPLPQEVGDALLAYLSYRPKVNDTHVFITAIAPLGHLTYRAVGHIVTRAIHRAGVKAPSNGAHVLRHSAATEMLRQGVSLPTIGAVLRHSSVETTAVYAKVDVKLLQEIAIPWPEVTPC
nr:tyrosine-type recombinase/integrase [uncultured Desulfobacter sp.]